MKSIASRPVLALNFYFPENDQPSVHSLNGFSQFGAQPYKSMIRAANQEMSGHQTKKKERIMSMMANVESILENFLPPPQMEQTARFSSDTENKQQSNSSISQKSTRAKYHSEPEYFEHIYKNIQKINDLMNEQPCF